MAEPITSDRLAAIQAALDAVPAPPWQWIGDRRTRAMLTTTHSGWQYLLAPELPCDEDGAQAEGEDGHPIYADLTFRDQRDGEPWPTMRPAREIAVGRTDYDPDTIRDIDNPIARWMRDAPQYVKELLAEVDRLQAKLDAPCGSCHPCTNYADETWRAAGRKPPHVTEWDELRSEVDRLRAELDRRAQAAAEELVDQTLIRELGVKDGKLSLDLIPPREIALLFVHAAKGMLGDAPNYTETPVDFPREAVSMEVKAAGEYDSYVLTVQRKGKLTPHEARQQAEERAERAEAEAVRLRAELDGIRTRAHARSDELLAARDARPSDDRFRRGRYEYAAHELRALVKPTPAAPAPVTGGCTCDASGPCPACQPDADALHGALADEAHAPGGTHAH